MKKALFAATDRISNATIDFLDRWRWSEDYLIVSAFIALLFSVCMTISFILIPFVPGIGLWYEKFSLLTIVAIYTIGVIRGIVGAIVFRIIVFNKGVEPVGIWIIIYETMVTLLIPLGILSARFFPKKK